MIVLRSVISAAIVCTQLAVTERGTCAKDKQLVVATTVVAIIVVHIVGTFINVVVVVVCACLILWVLTALVKGMLAVDAMQMARLVELTVLGRGLAITTRVLIARATSFEAATIAIASSPAIALVMPCTIVVALLAFQEPLELLPETLLKLMAKLALGSRTKLLITLPLDQAIADRSKESTLEILGKSLQHLIAELAPAADVFCEIQAMERHINHST
jgi:hypothetical protein